MQEGGEKLVAVSAELRQLVRDVRVGYTNAEVAEKTGLTLSTLDRLVAGVAVSEHQIRRFAIGMGVDPKPLLEAARKVRPASDPYDNLAYVLIEDIGLSPPRAREIIAATRQAAGEEDEKAEAAA